MHELHFIDDAQLLLAQQEAITAKRDGQNFGLIKADYLAEMVRKPFSRNIRTPPMPRVSRFTPRFGNRSAGRVSGVRAGVLEYDRRHGYRGPEGFIDIPLDTPSASYSTEQLDEALGISPIATIWFLRCSDRIPRADSGLLQEGGLSRSAVKPCSLCSLL